MVNKTTDGYGVITISDEVIAACVIEATVHTKGVYDFSGGFSETLSKNILGKELKFRGIKIGDEEEGLVIDLNIIVDYGVKIPEIAWDLQKNIKREVEDLTEAPIKGINIHVQGVHFNEKEE